MFKAVLATHLYLGRYRQKDIKEDTKKAALKESLDQLGSSIEELNKQIGDLNSQVTTLQREAEERVGAAPPPRPLQAPLALWFDFFPRPMRARARVHVCVHVCVHVHARACAC